MATSTGRFSSLSYLNPFKRTPNAPSPSTAALTGAISRFQNTLQEIVSISSNKTLTRNKINRALQSPNKSGKVTNKPLRDVFGNAIGNLIGNQLGYAARAIEGAATGQQTETEAAKRVIKANNRIQNLVAKVPPANYVAAASAGTRRYKNNRKRFFGIMPEALTRPQQKAWWAAVNAELAGTSTAAPSQAAKISPGTFQYTYISGIKTAKNLLRVNPAEYVQVVNSGGRVRNNNRALFSKYLVPGTNASKWWKNVNSRLAALPPRQPLALTPANATREYGRKILKQAINNGKTRGLSIHDTIKLLISTKNKNGQIKNTPFNTFKTGTNSMFNSYLNAAATWDTKRNITNNSGTVSTTVSKANNGTWRINNARVNANWKVNNNRNATYLVRRNGGASGSSA